MSSYDGEGVFRRLARYFPRQVLDDELASFGLSYFTGFLDRMGEGELMTGRDQPPWEAIRLLMAPSFEPVLCVRVEHSKGVRTLTAIRGDAVGDDPVARERPCTASEWRSIWGALRTSGFWRMPASSNLVGMDGEYWLLEYAPHDQYRVVNRWSPDIPGPDAEFLRFGVGILTMAGFEDQVEGWLNEET